MCIKRCHRSMQSECYQMVPLQLFFPPFGFGTGLHSAAYTYPKLTDRANKATRPKLTTMSVSVMGSIQDTEPCCSKKKDTEPNSNDYKARISLKIGLFFSGSGSRSSTHMATKHMQTTFHDPPVYNKARICRSMAPRYSHRHIVQTKRHSALRSLSSR